MHPLSVQIIKGMDANLSALERRVARARDINADMRERQKQQLRDLQTRYGVTPTEIARRAGLTPSTLTRFLNDPDNGSLLNTATMAKIDNAFDAAQADRAEPQLGLSEDAPAFTVEGQNQSVMTIKTNDFVGIGILRGDQVLVDAALGPAAGDTVVARIEDDGRLVEAIRIYHPPFLFNPAVGSTEPEYVDNKRVTIAGVVRKAWRNYR